MSIVKVYNMAEYGRKQGKKKRKTSRKKNKTLSFTDESVHGLVTLGQKSKKYHTLIHEQKFSYTFKGSQS